jgi:putative addiction module component (TIGR02574 family)
MPMTREQLFAEAMSLDAQERGALAEQLLMSLDTDPGIESAWVQECRQRIEAVDRGELATVPGEEVMRKLRARLKR